MDVTAAIRIDTERIESIRFFFLVECYVHSTLGIVATDVNCMCVWYAVLDVCK